MKTLHLHIGLPKTATTYLQTAFFPSLQDVLYLGTPPGDRFTDDGDRGLGAMSCCLRRSAAVWQGFGDRLFTDMLGPKDAWHRAPEDVLISDEGIGRAASRPSLLQAHLDAIATKAADWSFGRVTAICAFRRQDRWYASHYAQVSDRNPRACQRDFERSVERLLAPEHGRYMLGMLLDYSVLHRTLVAALSRENVLMMPYEDLVDTPEAFGRTLMRFLGASPRSAGTGEGGGAGTGVSNRRSLDGDRWTLRPPGRRVPLRPRRLWAGLGLPQSVAVRRPGRSRSIALTPELSGKVISAFAESNRAVAGELDCDLRRHGYF